MKTYLITIEDELFGQMSGEFTTNKEAEAIETCKDFYAMANDTDIEHVEIVKVIELN